MKNYKETKYLNEQKNCKHPINMAVCVSNRYRFCTECGYAEMAGFDFGFDKLSFLNHSRPIKQISLEDAIKFQKGKAHKVKKF